MNILFFTNRYFPSIGGVEKHVEEISNRLVKKSQKITVLTMKHDKKLASLETRGAIKILRLPYSTSKLFIWQNILKYKELVKKADIIHAHDVFFWYLPFKLIFPLKPIFTTFHGWEGEYPIPLKNKFVRKLSEKLSFGNICIGDFIKKYYGTKPDFVSYGGVNSSDSQLIKTKSLNQIIFIGRLEKDLGLDIVIPALKKIKRKHKLPIYFIGDGPYRKQAAKVGKVIGFQKNLKPFFKKPAFVFSSSYLTILEAMINQRPVFSFYQNSLKKDYLTKFPGSQYIKIAGFKEELVSQFTNALKNHKNTDRLTQSAYNFAKSQTWDKVVDTYLKLWSKNEH